MSYDKLHDVQEPVRCARARLSSCAEASEDLRREVGALLDLALAAVDAEVASLRARAAADLARGASAQAEAAEAARAEACAALEEAKRRCGPAERRRGQAVTSGDEEVLADLRLQAELRWCRRFRQLLDLLPDGLSVRACEDPREGFVVVKTYPDGSEARMGHVRPEPRP